MSGLSIDHHLLAAIVILGQIVGLVGGLYLAYDLFGGPGGPLRELTKVVSKIALVLFISVFGYLALYLIVASFNPGLITAYGQAPTLAGLLGLGIGMGVGGGLGYAANQRRQYIFVPRSRARRMVYGLLSGAEIGGFGCLIYPVVVRGEGLHVSAALAFAVGLGFNLVNGWVTATVVARFVMRRLKARPESIPSVDRVGLASGALGGFTLGSVFGAGYWITFRPDLFSGVLFALAGAVIGAYGGAYIAGTLQRTEWHIDTLTARRLGILGTILLFVGFVMQALSELASLFDIHVR
jgi:hypothetical protein